MSFVEGLKRVLSIHPKEAALEQTCHLGGRIISTQNWSLIDQWIQSLPENSPFLFSAYYARACEMVSKKDPVRVEAALSQSLAAAESAAAQGWNLSSLQHQIRGILQQCLYIDPRLRAPRALKDWEGELRAAGLKETKTVLILSSANGLYFEKTFPKFFQSLQESNGPAHLHIHICNPTEKALEIAVAAKSVSGDVNFSFSVENSGFEINIFASRRYQMAGAAQRISQGVTVVTDMDVLWTSLANLKLKNSVNFDIGLYLNYASEPFTAACASFVVLKNSDTTQEFLSRLNDYLTYKLREYPYFWTLDQCALFTLLHQPTTKASLSNLETFWGVDREKIQPAQVLDFSEKQIIRRQSQPTYMNQSFGWRLNADRRPQIQNF